MKHRVLTPDADQAEAVDDGGCRQPTMTGGWLIGVRVE
jgi:hypothetical protein